MRRKKRKKNLGNGDYCFSEQWVWEGQEIAAPYNPYVNDFTVLDTFQVSVEALMEDTESPDFVIVPCDNCDTKLPFDVVPMDCDSAWILNIMHDTTTLVVEHTWVATDYCGNESSFSLVENRLNQPLPQYRDWDMDGYGDPGYMIIWTDLLPGYVDRAGDCDDFNPLSFEGNEENPLTVYDDDCDGQGNIDHCSGTDFLVIGDSCVVNTYSNINASLYAPSGDSLGCIFPEREFDVDVWFKAITPPSGSITIDVFPGENSNLSFIYIQTFSGTCDDPDLISCEQLSEEGLIGQMKMEDLIPGDTILIQLVGSNLQFWQGSFGICIKDLNPVSTSINKFEDDPSFSLETFPNPFTQSINIQVTASTFISAYEISLYDINGRIISKIYEKSSPDKIKLNLNYETLNLPDGLYFICLKTNQFSVSKRILKVSY